MKIGELSRRTGVSASTIRFYESKGLLTIGSRQANGYRQYPLEAVAVLMIIANAQQTGFTLDEIKHILPEDMVSWEHDKLRQALLRKIQDIEDLELRMAQNKAHLRSLIQLIDGKPPEIDCQENAVQMLTRMGISKAGKRPKEDRQLSDFARGKSRSRTARKP